MILGLLREAAADVELAVRGVPVQSRSEEVGMGADGEPTTRVDRVAEDALIARFETAPFPVTMISEEAGVLELRAGPDPVKILADPIDATVNACSGIPLYTTCLSAHCDGETVASVVKNLAAGELYEADQRGARLDGVPVQVRESALERAIVGFGPVIDEGPQRLLALMARRASGVRLLACPSLSMAQVGTGAMGAFVGLGRSRTGKGHRLFDVWAAAFFIRQAGGVVTDSAGEALPTHLEDLRSGTTVVAAPPVLHESILEIVAGLQSTGSPEP